MDAQAPELANIRADHLDHPRSHSRKARSPCSGDRAMARTPMTNNPPIPDPSIVREVIRLAETEDAACRTGSDTGLVAWDFTRPGITRRSPESEELLDYLSSLSAECLAGLYSLYRLAEGPAGTLKRNLDRYACSYYNTVEPQHQPYAAGDLAAKGRLAHGLRRGLQRLGVCISPGGAAEPGADLSANSWRFLR
jgi:hypothetical protein